MSNTTRLVSIGEQKTEAKEGFGYRTFSSLRHRDYRFLWFSIVMASAGQWVEQIALSWLVYDMTNSPLMLGVVNGIRAVPFLVFGPLGGVVADRVDRKKLMIASQTSIMVIAFITAILVFTNLIQVWHILVLSVLVGIVWSFNMPVRQAMLPSLVPEKDLMNAIALMSAGFNITRIVGPALAGLLVGVVGIAGCFIIEGIAYIGVVGMAAAMKVPNSDGSARNATVRQNLMEGFRYIKNNQTVFNLIMLALIPMLIAMPYATLMPVFARDVLEIGVSGLGLLMSAPGIGALVGTLALASLGGFRRKGWLLVFSGIALGVTLFLFAVTSWVPLALLFLVGVGGASITFLALINTMLQLMVPDELRGRVMSVYMLDMGLMPLGSLVAGAIADATTASFTVALMGALCSLMILGIAIKSPGVRRLE